MGKGPSCVTLLSRHRLDTLRNGIPHSGVSVPLCSGQVLHRDHSALAHNSGPSRAESGANIALTTLPQGPLDTCREPHGGGWRAALSERALWTEQSLAANNRQKSHLLRGSRRCEESKPHEGTRPQERHGGWAGGRRAGPFPPSLSATAHGCGSLAAYRSVKVIGGFRLAHERWRSPLTKAPAGLYESLGAVGYGPH